MILPLLPVAFILLGLLATVVRDGVEWALNKDKDARTRTTTRRRRRRPQREPLIGVQFHDQGEEVMLTGRWA